MGIPTTTLNDLESHLLALGMCEGQSVVIHSKLISFGRIEGGVETVYKALRNVIGPTGTLTFPAYTLNLKSNDVYDPRETPSHAMGVLSEYVRTLNDVVRSDSPMHGHLAIGSLASQVIQVDPGKPIGPGSSFYEMHNAGFHLLLLGCDFQEGATFVHHVEAEIGVPYRSWLSLPRVRKDHEGQLINMECKYYGHTDSGCYDNNLLPVQLEMEKSGNMNIENAPLGKSYYMSLKNLRECVVNMLEVDPYTLVNPARS